MFGHSRLVATAVLASLLSLLTACRSDHPPNILLIVWDTVRSDRLSLYGHSLPTTVFLDRWAGEALVFDDCTSVASSTVPAHGSMFTGLLPSEHGADNRSRHLAGELTTVAEILTESGYQTYLFSSNPNISAIENFHQGFQTEEHPWEPRYRERATEIIRARIPRRDRGNPLHAQIHGGEGLEDWYVKSCGELAQAGLGRWLGTADPERPWFAFLNLMEAHAPQIPRRSYRARTLSPDQVERSYELDRRWSTIAGFNFGLLDSSPEDLEILAGLYDAAIMELDDLLRRLLEQLRLSGDLDDTVVILTSDHGEHLGEHHLLDHRYSLYEGVVRVPMVMWWPGRVTAGRSSSPVSNIDVFATILEIAGASAEARRSVSLLQPRPRRVRLAEYPADFPAELPQRFRASAPDWNNAPFIRRLRALYLDDLKLLRASDGALQLFDVRSDPLESRSLVRQRPADVRRLRTELNQAVAGLAGPPDLGNHRPPTISEEQRRRLERLGYVPSPDAVE